MYRLPRISEHSMFRQETSSLLTSQATIAESYQRIGVTRVENLERLLEKQLKCLAQNWEEYLTVAVIYGITGLAVVALVADR